MNNYNVIACDLDGTLLGTDMTLSQENRQAIKELYDKGITFVPVTGRTICEMQEVFNLPEVRYVIYSNGAAIYDKQTKETIFMGIDENNARFVFDAISRFKTFVMIHKDGVVYYEKEKRESLNEYRVCSNIYKMIEEYGVPAEKIDVNYIEGGLESIVVFFAHDDEYEDFQKIILMHPSLYGAKAWENNFEIFFSDAGKDNALKILAQKLDISMQEIISIGDSNNDIRMTLAAGLGLAAENACDSMKEIADRIICSNDEHVVSYVNEHFFN